MHKEGGQMKKAPDKKMKEENLKKI